MVGVSPCGLEERRWILSRWVGSPIRISVETGSTIATVLFPESLVPEVWR